MAALGSPDPRQQISADLPSAVCKARSPGSTSAGVGVAGWRSPAWQPKGILGPSCLWEGCCLTGKAQRTALAGQLPCGLRKTGHLIRVATHTTGKIGRTERGQCQTPRAFRNGCARPVRGLLGAVFAKGGSVLKLSPPLILPNPPA